MARGRKRQTEEPEILEAGEEEKGEPEPIRAGEEEKAEPGRGTAPTDKPAQAQEQSEGDGKPAPSPAPIVEELPREVKVRYSPAATRPGIIAGYMVNPGMVVRVSRAAYRVAREQNPHFELVKGQ